MKSRVKYVCDACGVHVDRVYDVGSRIPVSLKCDACSGGTLIREYGTVHVDKVDDNVSFATQTMLYGAMPSGREKTVM